MKSRFIASVVMMTGMAILFGALIAGCGQDKDAPVLQESVQSAAVDTESGDSGTMDNSISMVAMENEPFVDTACLDCHTNRALLEQLAVEDEVVEVPSEGPG